MAVAAIALACVLVSTATAAGTQPNESWESAISSAGPAAWFRFNEAAGSKTIEDEKGSYSAENHGITLGGEGPFAGSGAGVFGGEAYAALPGDPLLGDSAFTVEAWVYWAGSGGYGQPVFELAGNVSDYLVLTPASSASKHPLAIEFVTPSGSQVLTTTKFVEKRWEHVAVTETSAGSLVLYVDGSKAASATSTLSPASLGSSVPSDYIGHAFQIAVPNLHGDVSNLVFYSKALSETQIAEHYAVAATPVDLEAPKVEGEAKEGAKLTATTGRWSSAAVPPETFKYTYSWEMCTSGTCRSLKGATKETYTVAEEAVGSSIRVSVTARTNTTEAQTAASAQTTAVEGIPVNLAAPTIQYEAGDAETAEVGEELTIGRGEWRAFPLPSFSYAWEACPKSGPCEPIQEHAHEAGYRVTNTEQQQGDKLRATVTSENTLGKASTATAATGKVAPGKPVAVAPPTIEGEPIEGEQLKVTSSGSWVGTEPIEDIYYQWLRCPPGAECKPIPGAAGVTDKSYTTSHADVGDTVEVQVTTKNSVREASATSHPSGLIHQKPLRNVTPPTIAGEAREGQQLTEASPGTWEGGLPIEYIDYTWLRCPKVGQCESISSGPSDTSYTLTSADVGATIELEVTAKNPESPEQSATSTASATVLGNPPANVEAPTVAGVAQDETVLTASPGVWTGTPLISYHYQWEHLEGGKWQAISGASSAGYTIAHELVGQQLRVQVTAENSVNHASVPSAATEAVKASVPVNALSPTVVENVRGTFTYTADEGTWRGTPPLSYRYQWESCGGLAEEGCLPIPGANEARYSPEAVYAGDRLRVAVTASNGAGEGTTESSRSGAVRETGGATDSWGSNYWAQLGALYKNNFEERPIASAPGLSGIAAIVAGGTENFGLLTDHEVDAWGNDPVGQLGNNAVVANRELGKSYVTVLTDEGASPLEGVQGVAAASNHAMALGENHWVYTWGEGPTGQLGNGHGGLAREWDQDYKDAEPVTAIDKPFHTPAEEGQEAVQIAIGGGGDYALLKDGEVMAWGRNQVGQLGVEWKPECEQIPHHSEDSNCKGYECPTGIGWEQCRTMPEPVVTGPKEPLQGVKAIYAGGEAAYALVGDGELKSWGGDGKGELGQAPHSGFEAGPKTSFTPPGYVARANGRGGYENVKGIIEVAAGYNDVLVRLADGEVLGWGDNEHGALGEANGSSPELCDKSSEKQCFEVAQPVKALEGYWTPTPQIEQLSVGSGFSVALIGHAVYALGANEAGELGIGTTVGPESCATTYQQQQELEKIKAENKEREAEGKGPLPEVAKQGSCSRERAVPVDTPGSVESEAGGSLTNVSAIEAGPEDWHTEALLEPGVAQPNPLLSLSLGEEAGNPLIDVGWAFNEPFRPQRILYRQRTQGPQAEPTGEGGGSAECEEEIEAKGKAAECPANETRPHLRPDYEQFLKETEELTHKEAKSEGSSIPRIRNEGEAGKNEELTLSYEGKWTGAPEIAYTYQWERCEGAEEESGEGGEGNEGPEPSEENACEAISEAGGRISPSERPSKTVSTYNYRLKTADLGYRVRVKITATNEIGPGKTEAVSEAVSEATPPVRHVGEANPYKSEGGSLKEYANPGSYIFKSYKGSPLIPEKVYEVHVDSAIWGKKKTKTKEGEKEVEGWLGDRSRVMSVKLPGVGEG